MPTITQVNGLASRDAVNAHTAFVDVMSDVINFVFEILLYRVAALAALVNSGPAIANPPLVNSANVPTVALIGPGAFLNASNVPSKTPRKPDCIGMVEPATSLLNSP